MPPFIWLVPRMVALPSFPPSSSFLTRSRSTSYFTMFSARTFTNASALRASAPLGRGLTMVPHSYLPELPPDSSVESNFDSPPSSPLSGSTCGQACAKVKQWFGPGHKYCPHLCVSTECIESMALKHLHPLLHCTVVFSAVWHTPHAYKH
jgi:hypothetical protein